MKNIIAVAAGKGGVGKSTVSTNLAAALSRLGAKVGILDADVYGPSIPQMMGAPEVAGRSRPATRSCRRSTTACTWSRSGSSSSAAAPSSGAGRWCTSSCSSSSRTSHWGELDYLVVDLPPGTGDAQLSLSQLLPITGAVMVTTPQEVSVIDVEKALAMWTRVEVPVLGLVENMSGFVCPSCGHHEEIFLRGGGRKLAERAGLTFLGEIPLQPAVSRAGDEGTPVVICDPGSKVAEIFPASPPTIACQLSVKNSPSPETGKRSSKLTLIR